MKNPAKLIFIVSAMLLTIMTYVPARAQVSIVPQPQSVRLQRGSVSIPASPRVYVDKKARLPKGYLQGRFSDVGITATQVSKPAEADIAITLGKGSGKPEGYVIRTSAEGGPAVTAIADDRNGALYSIESILQLLKSDGGKLTAPVVTITDWPQYHWRSFMLDVSRHFFTTDVVKTLIDEMVRLKLNTFHWHLTDDPGWRMEIKGYPKLTGIGAQSDYDCMFKGPEEWAKHHQGPCYYTQKELKDVVNYCAERGIQVIPEIEVPGHCYAATRAYPELLPNTPSAKDTSIYDVTTPAYDKFIRTVLTQVAKVFPSKIIHIGGDEANYSAWKNDPKIGEYMKAHGLKTYTDLQLYAINNIQKFLARKGVKIIGWNEITGDNVHNEAGRAANQAVKLDTSAIVQFWAGADTLIRKAIHEGYKVVNSDCLYTYLCWDWTLQKTYAFDPCPETLTEEEGRSILGSGSQMWGELIPQVKDLYHQVFPRLGALAECGWTKRDNKNYADFVRRIAPMEQLWKRKGYFTGQASYSPGINEAKK